MRKTILMDLDTQKDFMKRAGALYVPEAEDIIPRVADLMEYAVGCNIRVVSTMDTHAPDDPEFGQWPPHCVKGTVGWEKIEQSLVASRIQIPVDYEPPLPENILDYQQIVIEKPEIDPFSNLALGDLIELLGRPQCLVSGVATDYCVKQMCLGLLKRRCKVGVIINVTRSIHERTGREAIEELKDRGVEFITSAEVMRVAV